LIKFFSNEKFFLALAQFPVLDLEAAKGAAHHVVVSRPVKSGRGQAIRVDRVRPFVHQERAQPIHFNTKNTSEKNYYQIISQEKPIWQNFHFLCQIFILAITKFNPNF
jgi:hypothetical protein